MESNDEDFQDFRTLKRMKTSKEDDHTSTACEELEGHSANKNLKKSSKKSSCTGSSTTKRRSRDSSSRKSLQLNQTQCKVSSQTRKDENDRLGISSIKPVETDLQKNSLTFRENGSTVVEPVTIDLTTETVLANEKRKKDDCVIPKTSGTSRSRQNVSEQLLDTPSDPKTLSHSQTNLPAQNGSNLSSSNKLQQRSLRSEIHVSPVASLKGKRGPKLPELPSGDGKAAGLEVEDKCTNDDSTRDNRCPFCQMPFRALVGQSPNWHTMECMDIPLKAKEECPAGLMCDSTIPSHYRRYTHSVLALRLAGQVSPSDSPAVLKETGSPSPSSLCNSTPGPKVAIQKSQESKKPASQPRQKSSSPSSRKTCSGIGQSLSQSQSVGSQKNSSGGSGSIPSYFSPSGKKAPTPVQPVKNCSTVEEEELDPLLKLIVMSDSDSDEDVVREKLEDDDAREECEQEQTHLSEAEAEERSEEDFNEEEAENGFAAHQNGGLFQQSEALDNLKAPTTNQTTAIMEALPSEDQPSLHTKNSASSSVSTFFMQKQTSLFSFFKPQCHSANTSSKTGLDFAPSLLKPGLKRRSGGSTTAERKPAIPKSASETANLMRVPSPPRNVQRSNGGFGLTSKPQPSKGRPSSTNTSKPWQKTSGRQCPFYKKLPGTAISVDAFCYGVITGCQAYVLTHFHYDHYRGLNKRFSQPMYCSPVTANLVEKQVGVDRRWVNRLPLNTPTQVAGVWLTLMEANHCPGAVIILFELPNGKKLLHTGDFRADACMEQYPPLVNVVVDELYLDTTYCDPAYAFPSQKDAIDCAVSTALKTMEREPRTLVVCGAYTIGKERIFIALAEALQSKVCVQSAKKRVLDCLEDDRLKNMISLNWNDGCVHVIPMGKLNAKGLEEHRQHCPQFTSVLAFQPTGWTHSNKALSLDTIRPQFSRNGITLFGVPYSEHSSFLEMKRFVQFLRPKKILPTVNNGNPASRQKMEAIFSQWVSEGSNQNSQNSARNSSVAQQSLGNWLKK
ncbi:DNA cross-link repair 1A protein-like [Littorina saxatilis]|uniref:DNA cross-link repair 1A protein-like n=1 Tax=Littorina saxatilis TaxID=31220 RepID=UPI0038B540B6